MDGGRLRNHPKGYKFLLKMLYLPSGKALYNREPRNEGTEGETVFSYVASSEHLRAT